MAPLRNLIPIHTGSGSRAGLPAQDKPPAFSGHSRKRRRTLRPVSPRG